MEKIKERTSKYAISIRPKNDKYYEARISLNFGGDCKARIAKGGKTVEEVVLNLLTGYLNFLDDSFSKNLILTKIDDTVSQRLVKSINELCITSPDIMQKTLEIVNKINYINSCILCNISIQSNILPFNNHPQIQPIVSLAPQNNIVIQNENQQKNIRIEKCLIQDLATEWMNYRISLCKKSSDNPNPLSQNTIDNSFNRLHDDILPYFKKNKVLYFSQITVELVEGLFKNIKCQNSKHKSYVVLNMLFKYAIKHNKTNINIMEKVDKPSEKIVTGEEDDDYNYIEPDKQNLWLDLFEKENTNMSLLFETMLLTRSTP